MDPDIHRRQSERAEQRAEDARQRICAARTATERHEQLFRAGAARRGELPVRAAAFQRDAQELFERAAALQELPAAHDRRVSEILIAGGSPPPPPMPAY